MAAANDFITKAHVQYLTQYLLYGSEPEDNSFISNVPIRQRCEKAEKRFSKHIRKVLEDPGGDSAEYGRFMDDLVRSSDANFEAGLISGLQLACTIWMSIDPE